ncbi:MAG: hypothetical protein Q9216_006862 [Gyalolechia sp. 2 TL-2023]
MMQCHEYRLHSAFPFPPASHETSNLVKGRQSLLFDNHSSLGLEESVAPPDISEATPPLREVMRATRKDTGNLHPRTSQPAVVPAIPEPWYECLNETGPKPGSAPFIDDDPPFYLQKSASDDESTFALQAERLSSRPGQSSQPAPLSYSLLSRLELSENDPNTFREVIDDLTVQNKRLKKRLKRYERINTQGLKHSGLFELRVQNLPYDKKQELEVILQRFASTIHPSKNTSVSNRAGSNRAGSIQPRGAGSNLIPSSPPYAKGLDSAYASVSATGATFKPTSGRSDYSISRARSHMSPSAEHELCTSVDARPQRAESPSLTEISDVSKQRLAVERLQELFLTGNGDVKSIIESNLLAHSPQSRNPSNDNAHITNYAPSIGRQTRSPPYTSRHLRHLDDTPQVTGFGAESQHEWVYLNLLINLAQLHTLNITPELVRSGIQATSTRLVLSEDGSKVRWQGDFERSVTSPDHPDDLATTHHASTAASLIQPEPTLQLPEGQALEQYYEESSSRNERILEPGDNIYTFAPSSRAAKRSNYKPLFAHQRQHAQESSHGSSNGSQKPGSSLSDTKESIPPDPGDRENATNGPLVFFDGDSFFLDLSSDPTDANSAGHLSYSNRYTEPLGWRSGPYQTDPAYERKQAIPTLRPEDHEDWNQSPPLRVNDGNPTSIIPDDDPSASRARFHFQASGIGGIHLADNFAIDVQTARASVSHPVPKSLTSTSSLRDDDIPASPRFQRHRVHNTQILSCTTTHLPPSPLPPPSYVYPALSSSTSSETDDGYSSLDDLDSESDYELRKVSLSPQVRMWVEEQSLSPTGPPEGDDGCSEGSASDGHGDGEGGGRWSRL